MLLQEVSIQNFKNILLGNETAMRGIGTGKVLKRYANYIVEGRVQQLLYNKLKNELNLYIVDLVIMFF